MAIGCASRPGGAPVPEGIPPISPTVYGAEVLLESDSLLAELRGKRLGLVINHTSKVYERIHLLDTLLRLGMDVRQIFAPEHGFRGDTEGGDAVPHSTDPQTGIPIFSLYAENKQPTAESLSSVDVVLFDIQDVGARFYTYLTTLGLVLEACAEHRKPLWVLDRPNPNGHAVGGPVLEQGWESFVGAYPIPILHGLTLGEFARLIVGQGWLRSVRQPQLTVVPLLHWWHGRSWEGTGREWVPPSPNLLTPRAARLYPGLCWFEGTNVSVGRGTAASFERVGYPGAAFFSDYGAESPLALPGVIRPFTPRPLPGRAAAPLYRDTVCVGFSVVGPVLNADTALLFGVQVLVRAYRQHRKAAHPIGTPFFNPLVPSNPWFEKLSGGPTLRLQVEQGMTPNEILAGWAAGVAEFRKQRKPYLLYPETDPLPSGGKRTKSFLP